MSYLGQDIKKLGFGMMRLPKKGEEFDVEETKKMVDLFMEAGFTYFDTAWAYAGSEDATRKALVERYPRESFQLATKLSAWIDCKTREDAIAQFETSLKQTGAGYFDFYLLHNLGGERTPLYEKFDLWNFVQEKKAEGLIRHCGFSFHSSAEELDEILTKHPEAEFVQLQINYSDWDDPEIQSRRCYEVARKHGKPVVIMEPVKGGMLADLADPVKEILQKEEPDASCASWAIRFAADLPGVITVLSGMSTIEQMKDNISYMKDFTGLSASQKDVLSEALAALKALPLVPCTNCHYCEKVCPEGIGIPDSFTALNLLTKHQNWDLAKYRERRNLEKHGRRNAANCIRCGKCEEVCPQHIKIREMLQNVCNTFRDEPDQA